MIRRGLNATTSIASITRSLSRTAQDSYVPQSPRLWEASTSTASETDLDLLRRDDFVGIASRMDVKLPFNRPEIGLARLQKSYQNNFRIPADSILAIVLQLEANDAQTIAILQKSPRQWLPLLISSCGLPMSNLDTSSRQIIFDRLWTQINRHEFPVDIDTYNARLRILLENEVSFNPEEELASIEQERCLTPNQESFHYLLEQIASRGEIEKCKAMTYKMANQGCVIDAQSNAGFAYCFAIRGFIQKADSLVEQSEVKYGKDGYFLALGACARAAAARGDLDRLRNVLRRSVDTEKRLLLSPQTVFDIIWHLSMKNKNDYGRGSNIDLIEQILSRVGRPRGYFRLLFREMERHVTEGYYYTAVALLDDLSRIKDCLENQQRELFLTQFISRMCRQMIRSRVSPEVILDVANRISAIFKQYRLRIYDDLLYSSLMYRDFTIEERFHYVKSWIDTVDGRRERPHLILPLIASVESVEDRLKIMFRCSNLGYKDLSQLDIQSVSDLILKPLYDEQFKTKNQSSIDKTARVLKSFGVSPQALWRILHKWSLLLNSQKETAGLELGLQGWLRHHYASTFENNTEAAVAPIKTSYEKLKTIVNNRDSTKAITYVTSYGWPEDTDFVEVVPEFLEIVLAHEDWPTVKKFLTSLSTRCGHNEMSPVKNYHILKILTRFSREGENINITDMIDLCYELKRLFPQAVFHYDHIYESISTCNTLFYKIFERLNKPEVKQVDAAIDLLRTLVKIEFMAMHATETLTAMFIRNVLAKLGWNDAVNVWMKFQSGLHCSNGIVALLRHCIFVDHPGTNVQYLMHKAQNFISASKVHLFYTAVLISLRKPEEAEIYIENNKNAINSWDCVLIMRVMNNLRISTTDEDFNLMFLDICLKHTDLKEQAVPIESAKENCLRFCETRNLAPLGLRLFKKFKDYNVTFSDKEKLKLWKLVEEHSKLAQRWIFGSEGFLRIKPEDSIIRSVDVYGITNELRREVEEIKTGKNSA